MYCLAARHVEKFRKVTPLGPKVIGARTLNFETISKFRLLKIVGGGTPSPVGCGLASFGHTEARVKIEGASPSRGQNMIFRQSRPWVGQNKTSKLLG